MSARHELLAELRRALALDVESGRGRVLDAELRVQIEALGVRGRPIAAQAIAAKPIAARGTADRAGQMAALAARADACTRCGLHATRNRVVTGDGDLNAALMLVGEAPGHDEDQTGLPFVGRAGQLLNRILEAIKLERRQVYVANVLKCRPPENRSPAPVEVTSCSPFLYEQIEIVRPRVICALGRFAANTLLGTRKNLAELRGRVHDYRGIPVVVTYHPSALLRDPSHKRPTWEDMQLVQRLLAGAAAAETLAVSSQT